MAAINQHWTNNSIFKTDSQVLFLAMPAQLTPGRTLTLLIFSQFAGTSLWFAGNAIIDQLSTATSGDSVTSFVQFGFIAGTLVFSLFTIADRFAAKNVFFVSSLFAAFANFGIIFLYHLPFALPVLRFVTGFFLAGIYPVGMKIAADLFPRKMGKALGLLVGALVLGTAFPHFVRSQLGGINWQVVLIVTSVLAFSGGLIVYCLIPELTKKNIIQNDFKAAFSVFRRKPFRSAAFGYFGHMWELYAFWSILPALFLWHNAVHQTKANPFLWSFLVIATGSIGCAVGGALSPRWGSRKVAITALFLSGFCCLLGPFVFHFKPIFFYPFLLLWGITVAADSPQFSALVAASADDRYRGTALTIVTSVGFAITIISIQWLKSLFVTTHENALWLLAPGPLFGLLALKVLK